MEQVVPLGRAAVADRAVLPQGGQLPSTVSAGNHAAHPPAAKLVRSQRSGDGGCAVRDYFNPREECEMALAHDERDQVEGAYSRSDYLEKRRPAAPSYGRLGRVHP